MDDVKKNNHIYLAIALFRPAHEEKSLNIVEIHKICLAFFNGDTMETQKKHTKQKVPSETSRANVPQPKFQS